MSKRLVGGAIAAAVVLAAPMVASWEGKRNDPYADIVGVQTVCYGETRVPMRHYSDAECDSMLADAVAGFAGEVLACAPALAPYPHALASAASLAYNIGAAAWCRSTAARRFQAGDIAGGCDAMMAWTYAGGRELPGLQRRRADERALCLLDAG